ncbi:MAG: ABC transporter permease [Vicinamibacteraceae bacterium]
MQKFIDAIRLALASIWAGKLRSFMTVLGNIVAVTSIIAVVSLIRGMNSYVSDAILSDVGAGTFKVERQGPTTSEEEEERQRNNPRVTMVELETLSRAGDTIDSVMAQAYNGAPVVYRDEQLDSVQVRGVSKEYLEFSGYDPELGRLPSRFEVESSRPVCFLGYGTADRLFKGASPLDRSIQIRGVHFRVIGVNEEKGSLFGNSQDEFIVVPLGVFQKLFGSRRSLELTVKPRDPMQIERTMDEARVALRSLRKLGPKEPDNFGMYTSDTIMNIFRAFTAGAFSVLIGVVGLSLVVGGVVIMNIMLMVVSERTREIGLRKALGARKRDIVWQILTESTTLSIAGGLVGTLLGFVVALIVAQLTPLPAKVELWAVAMGIGMTAIVGLFFGLYPAIRAASLDPIEALRRE